MSHLRTGNPECKPKLRSRSLWIERASEWVIECVVAYSISPWPSNTFLLKTRPSEECFTIHEEPRSFNPEGVDSGMSCRNILTQPNPDMACSLSAANMLLSACHVPPPPHTRPTCWRSEVEWNHSYGLHRGEKRPQHEGKCGLWRESRAARAWSRPSPHFHPCRKLSLLHCSARVKGKQWEWRGSGFHIAFSVWGRWGIPVNVWFHCLCATESWTLTSYVKSRDSQKCDSQWTVAQDKILKRVLCNSIKTKLPCHINTFLRCYLCVWHNLLISFSSFSFGCLLWWESCSYVKVSNYILCFHHLSALKPDLWNSIPPVFPLSLSESEYTSKASARAWHGISVVGGFDSSQCFLF